MLYSRYSLMQNIFESNGLAGGRRGADERPSGEQPGALPNPTGLVIVVYTIFCFKCFELIIPLQQNNVVTLLGLLYLSSVHI